MMVLVDFETTGLLRSTLEPKEQPGLIQIAAIQLDASWEVVGEYETLVDPETFMEEDAFKTHGISLEKARPAGPLPAHFYDFANFVLDSTHWVGFNIGFDKRILWWQLQRYNLEMKFPWPPYETDVMMIGRDVANIQGKSDVKYPKLSELHTFLFNEGFASAHDALEDCRATARCGKELWKRGYI